MITIGGVKLFNVSDLLKLTAEEPSTEVIVNEINSGKLSFEDLEDVIILEKNLDNWEYFMGGEKITVYSKKATEKQLLIKHYENEQKDPMILIDEFERLQVKSTRVMCNIFDIMNEQKSNFSGIAYLKIEYSDKTWSLHFIPSLANFIKFLASTPVYVCGGCNANLSPKEIYTNGSDIRCCHCKDSSFEPVY